MVWQESVATLFFGELHELLPFQSIAISPGREVGFEPTNSTYNFESMFSSENFAVCARTKHIFVSFA